MFMLFLDMLVLISLIKLVTEEDLSLFGAVLLVLGTVISMAAAVQFLIAVLQMPLLAIALGSILVGMILGALLSLLFGVEIKRALGVGVAFALIHVVADVSLQLMFA